MGCWRLHWSCRNGKSQTYSWTRLKPNKQTLLVLLLHTKHLNPEFPRAQQMQRRIYWLFFFFALHQSKIINVLKRECRTKREFLLCKAEFLVIAIKKNPFFKLIIFFPKSIQDFLPVLLPGCPEAMVLWYQTSFQPRFTVMLKGDTILSARPRHSDTFR